MAAERKILNNTITKLKSLRRQFSLARTEKKKRRERDLEVQTLTPVTFTNTEDTTTNAGPTTEDDRHAEYDSNPERIQLAKQQEEDEKE